MRIRTSADIYPSYYLDPPQDEDIRRECMAHLNENVQVARDVYEWIDRKDCPYQREHYAGMTAQCLSEMIADGARMDYGLRLEIEAHLHACIRYAQTDQIAEEIVAKEQQQTASRTSPAYAINPVQYTHEERLRHMERQIEHLSRVVNKLMKENDTAVCSYIMPGTIKSMAEIDAELRNECAKSSPELANYLKMAQVMNYLDFRGDSLPTIYETLSECYAIRYKYDTFFRACRKSGFFPREVQK